MKGLAEETEGDAWDMMEHVEKEASERVLDSGMLHTSQGGTAYLVTTCNLQA